MLRGKDIIPQPSGIMRWLNPSLTDRKLIATRELDLIFSDLEVYQKHGIGYDEQCKLLQDIIGCSGIERYEWNFEVIGDWDNNMGYILHLELQFVNKTKMNTTLEVV